MVNGFLVDFDRSYIWENKIDFLRDKEFYLIYIIIFRKWKGKSKLK